MIAATSLPGQFNTGWQQTLADAIVDPAELCAVLDLDPALVAPAFAAAREFPLRVPRAGRRDRRMRRALSLLFSTAFPVFGAAALRQGWQPVLARLQADPDIQEVILSGGDPLSLSDRRLAQFIDELQSVRHVRRLRIHTRYPVVLPERIDAGLLDDHAFFLTTCIYWIRYKGRRTSTSTRAARSTCTGS